MGFFSGIFKGVKKVFKSVTKVVKKVVKSISKVGKKIWKGVKGLTKKLGKLGPLAAIAIGFIPGFQGLWASSGIWGAMAKGAITGFITSGGKVKGALMGAVGGGIGYGLNAGMNAYKQGVSTLGENATISEQITAGFKAVGNSTTEGVMNMYKSASDVLSTGDFGKLNYLDNTGQSIYSRTLLEDANAEVAYDKAIGDIGPEIHERASQNYINNNPSEFGKRMSPKVQQRMMKMSMEGGEAGAINQAKAFGYNSDVGKEFYKNYTNDYRGTPSKHLKTVLEEVYDYSKAANSGLDQGRRLWEQTGGYDQSTSFDWSGGGTEPYKYTADGLRATRSSGAGGTPTYISPQEATVKKGSDQSKNISNALSSLGGSGTTPAGLLFSTEDTGDQYDVAGGLKSAGGTGGVSLNYADYYGGAQDPLTSATNANKQLQSLLAQYASR